MEKGRADVMFDRSPAADLWRHTIAQIPTIFGRLVYLSSLRDPNTGVYKHWGLAQQFGEEAADQALRQSHAQNFAAWLAFSLEGQKADLDLYLTSVEGDRNRILETWITMRPYANLVPAATLEVERRLYASDLEALLELLIVFHGVSSRGPDASQLP